MMQQLILYDEYGTLINSQNTSSRGFYYFNVIPLDNYTIEVVKKDYHSLKTEFSAHKTNNNTYLVNLEIEKQVIEQENKLPKTNITPENGNSDFFKKQSPDSNKKEKISRKNQVNPKKLEKQISSKNIHLKKNNKKAAK